MSESLKSTIINSIDSIVHLLRIGGSKQGYEEIMKLIDYLMLYTNSIKNEIGGSEIVININNVLPHLLNAMQNKDYVFMCDILKYELRPTLAF